MADPLIFEEIGEANINLANINEKIKIRFV